MSSSNSPDDNNTTSSNSDAEDSSQLVAQLTASYHVDVDNATTTATTATTTATTAVTHQEQQEQAPVIATTRKEPVLIAPNPHSSQHEASNNYPPPNATPLPKSLGGAFGAAQWAADARNRKPSKNGIVQPHVPITTEQHNPINNNSQSDQGKQGAVVGSYISPYYVDLGNGTSSSPWINQQQQPPPPQQRQNQPDTPSQSTTMPSPANGQVSSPWTPSMPQAAQNSPLPNDMATPGAPTPAPEDDDSDSDTAEQGADGSTDQKYRNRNGTRQRLSHEDKINVIRIAIEYFPKVKPRWRQLNDFWAQVGIVFERRFGKAVGKIRPMADRLIKIHRAYVERCEQIPGSHRDETAMTKVLDQWIALEDPLKAMSKTWQLSQHDVDGNRTWPTKKRAREEAEGDQQAARNGVEPSMRPLLPQSSFPGPMNNNGFPPQPQGSQPQFHPPPSSFPPPPPPAYFPQPDPRMNNGTPQRPPNAGPQYSSPYPNNMNPSAPSPIQALSSIEEAMKSLANVMQREQVVNHQQQQQQQQQQQPKPSQLPVAPIHWEKRMDKLNKRLDKLEETQKRDMDEIRKMFGELAKRLDTQNSRETEIVEVED